MKSTTRTILAGTSSVSRVEPAKRSQCSTSCRLHRGTPHLHSITARLLDLKFIYSSIQVSNVLVRTIYCNYVNFVFHKFPHFIPEMSVGFRSYVFQIKPL
jgi:hypothetical protein